MKLFDKNLDREVAIVAEIGVNHEGDVRAASRLVRLAAEAGADAVKFQSYTAERFASSDDAERLARVRRFALDEAAHRQLAAEAAALGVTFFSTAVTEDWVPLLAELAPVVKIASGDLTFEPVIRAAAATGKLVILSTGLGTVEEIDRAVSWLRAEIGNAEIADRLVLLHCISAYPTPLEEANLLSIPYLAERYGIPVGYSNHVSGIDACLAAIALGAQVIEAHFTDSRTDRTFRDHELSLEPDEMAELVRRAPAFRASRGAWGKTRQASELPLLNLVRKGLVAARDLGRGHLLARDDLMYARPATGFASGDLDQVLGRRLAQPLGAGARLTPEALER